MVKTGINSSLEDSKVVHSLCTADYFAINQTAKYFRRPFSRGIFEKFRIMSGRCPPPIVN